MTQEFSCFLAISSRIRVVHLRRDCFNLRRCAEVMGLVGLPTDVPICSDCRRERDQADRLRLWRRSVAALALLIVASGAHAGEIPGVCGAGPDPKVLTCEAVFDASELSVAPGTYTITLTGHDGAGNASAPLVVAQPFVVAGPDTTMPVVGNVVVVPAGTNKWRLTFTVTDDREAAGSTATYALTP